MMVRFDLSELMWFVTVMFCVMMMTLFFLFSAVANSLSLVTKVGVALPPPVTDEPAYPQL